MYCCHGLTRTVAGGSSNPDLWANRTEDWAACCAKCAAFKGCKAWTFFPDVTQLCHLHGSEEGKNERRHPLPVSGTM